MRTFKKIKPDYRWRAWRDIAGISLAFGRHPLVVAVVEGKNSREAISAAMEYWHETDINNITVEALDPELEERAG